MNLFNRKTLKRHIKPAPVPADHLAALDAWADMIHSGRVYALKETALHGQFAAKIIEGVLGYHGPAVGADYTVSTEQAILQGSVDLALSRFGGGTRPSFNRRGKHHSGNRDESLDSASDIACATPDHALRSHEG